MIGTAANFLNPREKAAIDHWQFTQPAGFRS
jgi:hypothetical protein